MVVGHPTRFDVPIQPDMAAMFRSRAEDPNVDALDWLWRHVAPQMVDRQRARTACLIAAASEHDRAGRRGRIHVLLRGQGGTGKTILKDWLKNTMPDALGVGPDSSGAGLKINGNTGELGKLAKADGGTLCVEELDKFDRDALKATYEAMSEGYFEVDKGGLSGEIDAELRIVAVANSNDFPQPLRSRFDFNINMAEYDADETVTVASELYDDFRVAFVNENPDRERAVVPQYLAWVEDFRPGLSEVTVAAITEGLERLIREEGEAGDIRQKEAYLRIAYVIAKLNRRDVSVSDWVRAVDLVHPEVDAAALLRDETEAER